MGSIYGLLPIQCIEVLIQAIAHQACYNNLPLVEGGVSSSRFTCISDSPFFGGIFTSLSQAVRAAVFDICTPTNPTGIAPFVIDLIRNGAWRQSGNIFDNPGIHRGPFIREVMNSFSNFSFYHPTTMPSAQSSLSASEKVGPVNKQPPAALPMSTDPNEQGKRAMRLRGGCLVRHSNAVPISGTYIFSRNVMSPVGAAM